MFDSSDLKTVANSTHIVHLSISDLESLYRIYQSKRFKQVEIIRELERCTAESILERFKKDYCIMTFQNELEYISFVINAPIGDPSEYQTLNMNRNYSSDELLALIISYSGRLGCKSVYQYLMLEQCIDYAIEKIEEAFDLHPYAQLIAKIACLNFGVYVTVPQINNKLKQLIEQWEQNPSDTDLYMVPVLYSMQYITKDWKYERMARRILTTAYKSSLIPQESIGIDIDNICTVAENLNLTYRYSTRKLLARWTAVIEHIIDCDIDLSALQTIRLFNAVREIGIHEPIPSDSVARLQARIAFLAETGNIIASSFQRSLDTAMAST